MLADRFGQAKEMVKTTSTYYNDLSSTIPSNLRAQWEKEIVSAENNRLHDPAAMDIIGTRQLDGTTESVTNLNRPSSAAPQWLTLALSIEERQYVLLKVYTG